MTTQTETLSHTERAAQKAWTPLTPAGRRRNFRMGNVPMTYSPWSELSQHERELVVNAYRVVSEMQFPKSMAICQNCGSKHDGSICPEQY